MQILSSLPAHDNIIRCFGYSIGAPKGSGTGVGVRKQKLEVVLVEELYGLECNCCFMKMLNTGGDGTVKVLLELCHGHLLDFQALTDLMLFLAFMSKGAVAVQNYKKFLLGSLQDSKGGKLSPKEMMEPFVQIADAVGPKCTGV